MNTYTRDDLKALLSAVANDSRTPKGPFPNYDLFAAIALLESDGDPVTCHQNTNHTIDRGLWQINSVHAGEFKDVEALAGNDFRLACYTPLLNAMLAVCIWRKQGYNAWTTYRSLL